MKKHLIGLLILSVAFLMSCEKDKDNSVVGKYDNGIFIVSEGAFGTGNGRVDFYDDGADTTATNIFSSTNGRPLGDVVQSMTFHNDYAYIVVNNSNKVEVVDATTFEEVATITGLNFPRFFLPINDNKAYVTQWGWDGFSGSVQIIDLNTNSVTDSIITNGFGPDKIAMIDNTVYVGHNGGYGTGDNFVTIDPNTDTVLSDITSEFNPDDFVQDKNGLVWVLNLGAYNWTTMEDSPAKITAYNPSDLTVAKSFDLPASVYSTDLKVDAAGDKLYFIIGTEVLEIDVDDTSLSLTTLASGSNFYGLGYDATTGYIYAGIAPDFSSEGTVNVYNENGDLLKTINTGVGPSEIVVQK